jgi:4-diphosphocytidyl-2-C-methyl-D-erythritol kinase
LKKHVPVKITVRVKKNIPIGAGLAGGSADAAATLSAINRYYGNYIPLEQLLEIAARIGSDVPFSLCGGTSVGRGRGEILLPVLAQTNLYVILVKPKGLSVSTAWAYDAFDQSNSNRPLESSQIETHQSELISLLSERNISASGKLFQNSFESLVFEHHPVLQKIRQRLIDLGCFCARMTGSGPTIYGLVRDPSRANDILRSIANDQASSVAAPWYKDHGIAVDTWLAKSIDHGIKVIGYEENQHKI